MINKLEHENIFYQGIQSARDIRISITKDFFTFTLVRKLHMRRIEITNSSIVELDSRILYSFENSVSFICHVTKTVEH